MDQLSFIEKKESNYTLYELSGSFTFDTLDDFRPVLYKKIEISNVVLDLSGITGIDSSGVGLLLAARTDSELFRHILYLLTPSDCVARALEETGLIDMMKQITSIVEIS